MDSKLILCIFCAASASSQIFTPILTRHPSSLPIVYDAVSTSGVFHATTGSWSHTSTSSANSFMMVFVTGDSVSSDASCTHTTGVTYNSVAMTPYVAYPGVAANRCVEVYYLASPSSGSHSVTITATAGQAGNGYGGMAVTYSGVAQSSTMDGNNTGDASSVTSLTLSEVVGTTGAWQVYGGLNSVGANSAGAATTVRTGNGVFASSWIADSNSALTTGSHSLQVLAGGTANFSGVIVSIKPAVIP